jgi:hypothetical protein
MTFWNYRDYKEGKRRGHFAMIIGLLIAVALICLLAIILKYT